jgi:hypothetical protein
MSKKSKQLFNENWDIPQWLLDFWFGQQNLSDAELLALWWYLYNQYIQQIIDNNAKHCAPGDKECWERVRKLIEKVPEPPGTIEEFQELFPDRPSVIPDDDNDGDSTPHTPIDPSPNTPAGTWPPPLSQ